MMHPDTRLQFISPEIGVGVVATAPIPRGTLIWVLDTFDRVLTPAERDALAAPLRAVTDRYAYLAPDGNYVLCWDLGRYMNHSCRPTSRGFDAFEIAVRDTARGEQLTCEYGSLNLAEPLSCACGEPDCRAVIGLDDADRCADEWSAEILAALPAAAIVPQPLLPFALLQDGDRRLLAEVGLSA